MSKELLTSDFIVLRSQIESLPTFWLELGPTSKPIDPERTLLVVAEHTNVGFAGLEQIPIILKNIENISIIFIYFLLFNDRF